jgi:hypothetical protein
VGPHRGGGPGHGGHRARRADGQPLGRGGVFSLPRGRPPGHRRHHLPGLPHVRELVAVDVHAGPARHHEVPSHRQTRRRRVRHVPPQRQARRPAARVRRLPPRPPPRQARVRLHRVPLDGRVLAGRRLRPRRPHRVRPHHPPRRGRHLRRLPRRGARGGCCRSSRTRAAPPATPRPTASSAPASRATAGRPRSRRPRSTTAPRRSGSSGGTRRSAARPATPPARTPPPPAPTAPTATPTSTRASSARCATTATSRPVAAGPVRPRRRLESRCAAHTS